MNLLSLMQRFPDQEACIAHLERIRFGNKPYCPLCGSLEVARKRENDVIGRWNCHDCRSSFNVLSGTVMQKTKIPLVKWFAAIALIVNAKKSISSYQLGRDLNLNQPSAHYLQQRIRAAMAADQGPLLRGIIEADETYVGGKPRKRNTRRKSGGRRKGGKRGRGTEKMAVLGAVERDGKVKAMVADDLHGPGYPQLPPGGGEPRG